jgi:hypothetical protein
MTVSSGGGDRMSIGGPDERALHAGLQRARSQIDAEIAQSAAPTRVAAAVLSETIGSQPRLAWLAIAATMVIAAGLGGLYESSRLQASPELNIVALDPLTFGAVAVDQ